MVATQIPGRGEGQRFDQTGEFAGADYHATQNRAAKRNQVLLIFVDAVFARTDEEKTNQEYRHLEGRQTNEKFAAAMPDGDEVNQRDRECEQHSDPKK